MPRPSHGSDVKDRTRPDAGHLRQVSGRIVKGWTDHPTHTYRGVHGRVQMSKLRASSRPPVGKKVAATTTSTGKRTGAPRQHAQRWHAPKIGTGRKGHKGAGRGSGTSSRGRSRKPKAVQAPKGTPNRVRGKASTVAPRANTTAARLSVAQSLMTPQRHRPHDPGVLQAQVASSPIVSTDTSGQSSSFLVVRARASSRSSSRSVSTSTGAGPAPAVATVSPSPRASATRSRRRTRALLRSRASAVVASPPSLPGGATPDTSGASGASSASPHATPPQVVGSSASAHTLTHRPAPLHPRPHSRSAFSSPASSRPASTALVAADDLRDVVADIMANVDARVSGVESRLGTRMDERISGVESRLESRIAQLSDVVQSLAVAMGGAAGVTVPGPAASAHVAPVSGGDPSAPVPAADAAGSARPTPAHAHARAHTQSSAPAPTFRVRALSPPVAGPVVAAVSPPGSPDPVPPVAAARAHTRPAQAAHSVPRVGGASAGAPTPVQADPSMFTTDARFAIEYPGKRSAWTEKDWDKLTIPANHTLTPDRALALVHQVETAVQNGRVAPDDVVERVLGCFRGAHWMTVTRRLSAQSPRSWVTLRRVLLELVGYPVSAGDWNRWFRNVRMKPGESFLAFGERVCGLCDTAKRLGHPVDAVERLREVLLNQDLRLHPQLSFALHRRVGTSTVAEVYDALRSAGSSGPVVAAAVAAPPTGLVPDGTDAVLAPIGHGSCFRCGKFGHLVANCPQPPRERFSAAAQPSGPPAQSNGNGRTANSSRQSRRNKRKGKGGRGGNGGGNGGDTRAGTYYGYFVCQGYGQPGGGAQAAPSSQPAAPATQTTATVAAAAPSAPPAQAASLNSCTVLPCVDGPTVAEFVQEVQPELDTGVFRVAAMKRGRPLLTVFRVGAEQIVVFVDTGADISLVRSDVARALARRGPAPPSPPVTVSGVFGAQRQLHTCATMVLGPERTPCSLYVAPTSMALPHQADVLLGMDLLNRLSFQLTAGAKPAMSFGGVPFPCLPVRDVALVVGRGTVLPSCGPAPSPELDPDRRCVVPSGAAPRAVAVVSSSAGAPGCDDTPSSGMSAAAVVEDLVVPVADVREGDVDAMLRGFDAAFASGPADLGLVPDIECALDTGGHAPICGPMYRVNPVRARIITAQVAMWWLAGVVKPAQSAWRSPAVLVNKKTPDGTRPEPTPFTAAVQQADRDRWCRVRAMAALPVAERDPAQLDSLLRELADVVKGHRLCINFRSLNSVLVGDAEPIHTAEERLWHVGPGTRFITTFDVQSAYLNIPMRPEDIPKTAFGTSHGLFAFTRMPFGLANAPAVMHRAVARVVEGTGAVGYFDDILAASASWSAHVRLVRRVLRNVIATGFKLNRAKCAFARPEAVWVDRHISADGLRKSPDKLDEVRDFPVPTCTKELMAFLGLAGYYRSFVSGYSEMERPLSALRRKGVKWHWGEAEQAAFVRLKAAILQDVVLAAPDWTKPFTIATDASKHALGGVLSQPDSAEQLRPICFAGRALSPAETRYSATERELLGVVWAVKHWHRYIVGTRFIVLTDHRNLLWLFRHEHDCGRVARWVATLCQYAMTICHTAGVHHGHADGLSRMRYPPRTMADLRRDVALEELPDDAVQAFVATATRHHTHPPLRSMSATPTCGAPGCRPVSATQTTVAAAPAAASVTTSPATPVVAPTVAGAATPTTPVVTPPATTPAAHRVGAPTPAPPAVPPAAVVVAPAVPAPRATAEPLPLPPTAWPRIREAQLCSATLADVRSRLAADRTQTIRVPGVRRAVYVWDTQHDMVFVRAHYGRLRRTVTVPVVPSVELQFAFARAAHAHGHGGVRVTFAKLCGSAFWRGMRDTVKAVCASCVECARGKAPAVTRHGVLHPFLVQRPLDMVHVDLVGPFNRSSRGNKYVFTMKDRFSRFVMAEPIPDMTTSVVVEAFFTRWVTVLGLPSRVVSDQGAQFTSALFHALCGRLGIAHSKTTPYHPQTNGSVERFHRDLKMRIGAYMREQGGDWERYLHMVVWATNTSVCVSTGYTPFKVMFGRSPLLPFARVADERRLSDAVRARVSVFDYTRQLSEHLRSVHAEVCQRQERAAATNKRVHDRTHAPVSFEVGDLVLVHDPSALPRRGSTAFASRFSLPSPVLRATSAPGVYEVEVRHSHKPPRVAKVHVKRMRLFAAPSHEVIQEQLLVSAGAESDSDSSSDGSQQSPGLLGEGEASILTHDDDAMFDEYDPAVADGGPAIVPDQVQLVVDPPGGKAVSTPVPATNGTAPTTTDSDEEVADTSALASKKLEILRERHSDDGPTYVCLPFPDADMLVAVPKDQLPETTIQEFNRVRRDAQFKARAKRLMDSLNIFDSDLST